MRVRICDRPRVRFRKEEHARDQQSRRVPCSSAYSFMNRTQLVISEAVFRRRNRLLPRRERFRLQPHGCRTGHGR